MSRPVGAFALVLHTHLPWLAHHGSWPVGEEWLYQAWADSYLPVTELLTRLSGEGRRDLVTLGVTPVLAAQLDDAYCRQQFSTWLGFWQVRAEELAGRSDDVSREAAPREFAAARQAMRVLEGTWSAGLSPVLRPLVDAGAVELLGGPATHAFQPLLPEPLVRFGLQLGLDDAAWRIGLRPQGLWAPECAYAPGLETTYAAAGATHLLVDGPSLLRAGRTTDAGWRVGDSDVVVFGRDLEVSYRVWSPRAGYPGGRWYRDFHTSDPATGLRTARVTSRTTPPGRKAPYDPARAAAALTADAHDFVSVVRDRLLSIAQRRGDERGLVVAAYDTELFGHWWHEGPQWLEQVLRLLPEAGIEVTTLGAALRDGRVDGRVDLGPGSWGSGKDFRVWDGPAVADLAADNERAARRLLTVVERADPVRRDPVLDQHARSTLLALASDWAFLVSKDTAARYARSRHTGHHADAAALADAWEAGDLATARALSGSVGAKDRPFPHLDARLLRGGVPVARPAAAATGEDGRHG